VTNYATNDFFPSSTFTFALLSGLTNVDANLDVSDLTNNGVLSWTTTTVLKAGTYTNVIKVTDNDSPYFSATNRFVIVVSSPPPPVLTVPPQTIYFGQTKEFLLSATNSAFPDSTNSMFTYEIVSAPAGASIGVDDPEPGESSLIWSPTTNAASVKTITIAVTEQVEDNSLMGITNVLMSTNSFQVIVSPTPPPALMVPDPQTIHAGQTLAVTISATNIVLTNSTFTFSLLPSTSTNVSIITSNNIGVLTWTNTGIRNGVLTWTNNSVSPGTKTNYVKVTDNSLAAMSATNSFQLVFLPPLPPVLTMVPTHPTVQAGQTLTVTIFATNTVLPNATFTFTSPSNNFSISTNSNQDVLTWTNTAALPGTYTNSIKVTDNNVVPPLSATNSFTVIVTPAPPVLIVSNLLSSNHSFEFSFHAATNTTWRILATTNLNVAVTNWPPVFTNTVGTSGTLQFTDLLATNFLHRFFRAVSP
jgi:hypothetical protein